MPHVIVTPTAELAASAAASLVADLITHPAEYGSVHIGLAGGRTPAAMYEQLVELVPSWHRVHLWFGDERVTANVPQDLNLTMAQDALLSAIDIPASNVHPIPTDRGAGPACAAYEAELREVLPRAADGTPRLDVVILGLGQDAHTASLFPDGVGLSPTGTACVIVEDAPKPPPVRVSLTMQVLNAASHRVMLATGQDKAGAVAAAFETPDPRAPASLLRRDETTWILDTAAASSLDGGAGVV